MQRPRALDLVELALDAPDPLLDLSPIGFDLGLAGSAEKAETAALAFQVGPGTNQPAFLIGEMRKLHLQCAFLRTRALAEDFKDQPGPVDDLRVPGLLQVSLLHRRERRIDEHETGLLRPPAAFDLFSLLLPGKR